MKRTALQSSEPAANRLAFFCDRCQKAVTAFAPEQIALTFRISLTEVCRRVEAEQIHLTSNERGTALICGDSLEEKSINK